MNLHAILIIVLFGLIHRASVGIYNEHKPSNVINDTLDFSYDQSHPTILLCPDCQYQYLPATVITNPSYSVKNFNLMSYMNKKDGCNALYSLLILMLAGDLHPNPGPYTPKFPCGICNKAAKWNQRATCCDQCDTWYHIDCMDMCTPIYEALQGSQVSWICAQCGLPNYASSLFTNSTFELSNSFSSLNDDCSGPLSPPLASSSPNVVRSQASSSNSNRSGTRSKQSPKAKKSNNTKSNNKKNLRTSLKLLVVNFDGLADKAADLGTCIENYNPDVIIGTETHLDSSYYSGELLPDSFTVFRKDRCFGKNKKRGGVLIALKNDIIGTHRLDLDTNCEIAWVTIRIRGAKDVTIGVFYRGHTYGSTTEYMDELRESLSRIKRSNKGQIWLGGDFNMPDINWETNRFTPGGSYPAISKQMLNIAADFGLEQIVTKPTRKNNTLDLFFTTNPTLVERSTTIPGMSDHDSIPLIIINSKPKIMKVKPHKRYLFHKANESALKDDLNKWSSTFVMNNKNSHKAVTDLFSEFSEAVKQAMDTHVPSKMISKRTRSPWINKRVRRLHQRKQRAFNAHRIANNDESYEHFKQVRKSTHKATKTAYKSYVASVCTESTKKFWSFIKSMKMDSTGISTLRNETGLEADNKRKAEILNKQFKSVFTTEDTSVPHEPGNTIPPMPDIIIFPEGVEKLLSNLDPTKATGPDDIGPRVLKIAAKELAPALSLIFQRSLDTSVLPESWLQANISPIHKKGDRSLAENYRPISLTSVCCKVLEHIVHSNIMNHFDNHSILTDKQHGFRSKHSTESQLILTVQDLAFSLENKKQVDLIIMDFSKAFDVVPHNRLLNKLKRYGIQSKTHSWISSFLKHRVQRVVVGGEHSTWADVLSGVPQGTVLGPLLFLTYINDLPNNINSSVRLFADDCVLYREIVNELDHETLQKDLNTLVNWQNKWQMSFNIKKCYTMRLTHAKSTKMYNYQLGDTILQETKSHPYLGVTISNDLSWNDHIQQITTSANRSLFFVMRNLYQCPLDIKVAAYKALVRPLLEYSGSVWDPHSKSLINQLEAVQRRAARFCLNDFKSRSPGAVTKMLRDLEWESLADRRQTSRLVILYKSLNGHLSLPIGNLVQPIDRTSRHTNSKGFKQLKASKDVYKYSFLPRTIIDWNHLPDSIVSLQTTTQFKNATKKLIQASNQQD